MSLAVGFAATTLSVVVSLLIGGVAGFVGGKLDLAVQRLVDAWMSFPGLLLLTIMTIIGQGIPQIIGMLALASGAANSRVVRGAVIGIKGNAYFEAACHRQLVVADAAASRVAEHHGADHGLPPDVPSWGTMLSREGRQYMEMAARRRLDGRRGRRARRRARPQGPAEAGTVPLSRHVRPDRAAIRCLAHLPVAPRPSAACCC